MITTVINKNKFCKPRTVRNAVINNEISLKELLNSKNDCMFKYLNTSQMIWESRIRYLKEYNVILENLLTKLDTKKTSTPVIKGMSNVSPELYNEVHLSLNLVKQILTYDDLLVQGTLKDLLKVYPIEDSSIKYITTEGLKLLFLNIKELEIWYFDMGVPLCFDEKLLTKEFKKYKKNRKTTNLYHDLFELIISYFHFGHQRDEINVYMEERFKGKNKIIYPEEYRLIQKRYLLYTHILLPFFLDMICLLYLKSQDEKKHKIS